MFLLKNIHFRFSLGADPYYILGVERTSSFQVIKKTYYNLANKYHPDKDNSKEAVQRFILVKQAFQMIKMEKGLMKPQSFVVDHQQASIRKNPEKYQTEDAEQVKNDADYQIRKEKAARKEYKLFTNSFQNINSMTKVQFQIQKGKLKDYITRFNLPRVKLGLLSQGGFGFAFIILLTILAFSASRNDYYFKKNQIQEMEAIETSKQQLQTRTASKESKEKMLDILSGSAPVREIYLRNVLSGQYINHRESIYVPIDQ